MPTQEEVVARYLNDNKGTKRKRNDGGAKSLGDITDEWKANDSDSTPWCKVDHSETANVGLRWVRCRSLIWYVFANSS